LCEFASIVEAVTCAMAIQEGMAGRELDMPAAERIRFRIGINVSDVIVEGEEIYGDGVNIAARLEGLAEPGGVCVSGKIYDEIRGKLDLDFEDLGEPALKNIARPVRAWRVADAAVDSKRVGRSAEAEPRFSVAKHNLPQQVTALVGRAAELAEIKARLDQHRVVTLVGSGGVGKTRLALQAAADLLERYPDGVWLVELAPLASPQLVAETVAGMFGGSRSTDRSAVEIVVASLKEKRTLLLLDNCEHLVSAVAQVAEAILRGCPTVSVLASSRENLAIAGENVYRVPSLDFPEDAEGITAAAALDHAAVRLFADRAGSVVDGFAVTDANAPAIAAICRRLDGVALAIELAVARLTMLKPHELASRLDDRFRLLTGGSRTALPRQQTLRSLIDWSYNLLTDPERTLLRRLSVFAGGWTLNSATTVCSGDPVEEREIFDLLASLIDKSLVVADATGDRTRYRLLESTRAYALEKVVESGECSHSRRLAEHVMALFSEAEASWATMATKVWLGSYAPELDNLRAALKWTFGPGGDIALGLDLTGRSLPLFLELSLRREQKRWFDAAVERIAAGTPPATAARLWLGSSFTHHSYYRSPLGGEVASRAVALFRETGDALGLGAALVRAGAALLRPDDTAAGERLLREALGLLRPHGRTKHLAACLNATSVAHSFAGDVPAARTALTEAATISQALGDSYWLPVTLSNLAEVEFESGAVELAASLARDVVAEARAANNSWALAATQVNLASYLAVLGSPVEAAATAKAGLHMARSLGLAEWILGGIETLALLAAGAEQEKRAARLLGYSAAAYAALGDERLATERSIYDRLCAGLGEALSASARERLMAEGAAWTEDQAVDEALTV
jgi:predicted ATPase